MWNIVKVFAILLWSSIEYRFLNLFILLRYNVVSSAEKLSTLILSFFGSLVPMFISDIVESLIELDRYVSNWLMARSASIVLIYNNHRVIRMILSALLRLIINSYCIYSFIWNSNDWSCYICSTCFMIYGVEVFFKTY